MENFVKFFWELMHSLSIVDFSNLKIWIGSQLIKYQFFEDFKLNFIPNYFY